MNRFMDKIISGFVIVFLAASPLVIAETIIVPVNQQSDQSIDVPAKGKSMQQVENDFGVPLEKSAAVGEPPITKWHYDSFTVYFESDIVIHTVLHRTK